jgi:hypothetical protein
MGNTHAPKQRNDRAWHGADPLEWGCVDRGDIKSTTRHGGVFVFSLALIESTNEGLRRERADEIT